MIVVTGGAGFIGSNLIKALNHRGIKDIIVVDDLTNGLKFRNIVDCDVLDYVDKHQFLQKIVHNEWQAGSIQAIFHQGACTSTLELDGRYLMQNNYEYSKQLLDYSIREMIPFIYASSAAIYGASSICQENPAYETPLNVYAYSKLMFDRYVQRHLNSVSSQIVGLRYFNVFGPNEWHKGTMKSVIQHFYDELKKKKRITIFDQIPGCHRGEQQRDFIYVADVIAVILWFYDNPSQRGIFNLGRGENISFNQIARLLIEKEGYGSICYQPIDETLLQFYQIFTKADISKLQRAGYSQSFTTIADAVEHYLLNSPMISS